MAKVTGMNVPPELAKEFGHFADVRGGTIVGRRRRGSGPLTPGRSFVRDNFKNSVVCFNKQTETQKKNWYNESAGSGMRYYNYFISKTITKYLAGEIPAWCREMITHKREYGPYNDFACRFYTAGLFDIEKTLIWSKDIATQDDFLVDVDGNIYVNTYDYGLRCYGKDGIEKWTKSSPRVFAYALVNDKIYTTNGPNIFSVVWVINKENGETLETIYLPSNYYGDGLNCLGNEVYIVMSDYSGGPNDGCTKIGRIVAGGINIISDFTGKYYWGGCLTYCPLQDNLMFRCRDSDYNSCVVIIDPNGQEIWSFSWIQVERAVIDNDSRVYCLNSDNSTLWAVDPDKTIVFSDKEIGIPQICFQPNGNCYTYKYVTRKYDRNGIERWTKDYGLNILICNDTQVIVSYQNYLHVLDCETGNVVKDLYIGWNPGDYVQLENGFYVKRYEKLAYYG